MTCGFVGAFSCVVACFLKTEGVADVNGEGCFGGAAIGRCDWWHGGVFLHSDILITTFASKQSDYVLELVRKV